jgi:hypothetical protein
MRRGSWDDGCDLLQRVVQRAPPDESSAYDDMVHPAVA